MTERDNEVKMSIKSIFTQCLLLISVFVLSVTTTLFSKTNQANATNELVEITVYKTPTCGCCGKWVDHLKNNGFKVNAINQTDLSSIKQQLGIATNLQACHTAKVGNYFVEGHVPASDIKKMLLTKPDIKGITVPGMPMGSPGMEGARVDKYDVLAIHKDQKVTLFSRY